LKFVKLILMLSVLAAGFLVGNPAMAHSFDTIFVAPQSGAQAATGKQARDGFMFAARERDAHPNETADGHLGGLDVYLLMVDSNASEADVMAKVREFAGRAADDAPRIVAPAALLAALRNQVSGVETVAIDFSGAAPDDMRTMAGRPFNAAFQVAFGYAATPAVLAGYAAARQIDTAVRNGN